MRAPWARWVPWVALALIAAVAVGLAANPGSRDDSPDARLESLTRELRCPTCQGLSVADSPSSTARAIVDDVRRRIEAGETDGEIRDAYVETWGEWILLEPQNSGVSLLVWLLPIAGLVLGVGVLVVALTRWRREPRYTPTTEDRELVERVRGRKEDPGATGAR
ncbi:MAG: cytochrome c-type biogenesis protein CcmH [Acidimicrobiia bacterium]|nr:cytochrome c-type biogenesis protein CcmH [Acidimicrobiia bacterium]